MKKPILRYLKGKSLRENEKRTNSNQPTPFLVFIAHSVPERGDALADFYDRPHGDSPLATVGNANKYPKFLSPRL